ncbi:MAG: nucleotidyltransferase family protein [Pseudomonadota bacterium]
MSGPNTAMILAAGFGTRMGALTQERPKPLMHVGGGTLIDHTLDLANDAGVTDAVINLHYRGPQIRAHLADRTMPKISFSEESPEILDTGGGLVQARPMLGVAPFFALNSDNVFVGDNPLKTLSWAWRPAEMDVLLLLVPTDKTRAYTRPGDFTIDTSGVPQPRGEAKTAPYVYTGAQIIVPESLDGAPEGAFSIKVIWERLRHTGRLRAVVYGGHWVDVGTPEGLVEAEAAMNAAHP